ncbi:MAG TPA: glycosyl hydrolase family 18 protein [Gemmatimonadaceae bacterium]|nr:glycosyl hydrolase family 18 protein [Gemmatimonadaceae bacterium]
MRYLTGLSRAVAVVAFALTGCRSAAAQRGTEALWYLTGSDASTRDFVAHASQISIAAPQVFMMDSTGTIRGGVDSRVVTAAKEHQVKLIPLVMNPGFDQPSVHRVLTNPTARDQGLRSLAALCREHHFDGIQFDFENIHVRDRDAFTAFARAAADSVHRAGCTLSAAVVPRMSDDPGTSPFDRYMYENWRGAYDYKALAGALDFISYMTYAQHAGGTTPGPVQGYPWTVACLEFVLSLGVPPAKLSLGLAGYSDWWYPTYSDSLGARAIGRDIGFDRVSALLSEHHALSVWDDEQKASRAEWQSHGVFQYLWIEDARAFEAKRPLVERYKLRGYSVWVLGSEDPAVWRR